MRPNRTGSFKLRAARFDRRTAGGEHVQRAVEQHRMQRILAGSRRQSLRTAPPGRTIHHPRRTVRGRSEISSPYRESQIAHVAVETVDIDWLEFEMTGWISVSKLDPAKGDSVRSPRIEPTTCSDQDAPWSNRLWIANVRSFGS